MDIRQEISLSKGDLVPQSSSNPVSDQNKIGTVYSGVRKTKATGSPRSKWIMKDMKSGDQVLNPMPMSQFDPKAGDVVKSGIGMKPGSVKSGDKVSGVVQSGDKVSVVEKDKASVVEKDKVSVVEKDKASVVEKDKVSGVVQSAVEKDKVSGVVQSGDKVSVVEKDKASVVEKDKVSVVEKDKASVVEKDKAPAVVKSVVEKDKSVVKSAVEKDKALVKSAVEKGKMPAVVKSVVKSGVEKAPAVIEKSKDKAPTVEKPKAAIIEKPKDKLGSGKAKARAVVKDSLSELKVKSKDKASELKLLSEGVKRKRLLSDVNKKEMKVKHLKGDTDIKHSGFKGDKKVKVDQKEKKSKVKVDHSDDEVKRKTKKSKNLFQMKLKRKRNDSDSDSSSFDEEKARRVYKALKNVKKEESDEENVPRRGKKNEKKLTREEREQEEYLKSFPTLRARTVPSSFFSAIRESRVDMGKFLSEIGFSSFHNIAIEKVPSRLGRYVVQNFNAETYLLRLDTGDSIKVTHSKIHEILGIPIGGDSLFSFDLRPFEHEFVRLWVAQFYPKSLKDIRVGDIASVLISAKEVDFLFKVNFLTLFTNTMGMVAGLKGQICLDVVRRLREETIISNIDWCDYIHHCLQYSEMPDKKTVQYLGPFLFLILLYLDSTKFEKFPVVRTRPAIRDWTSTLMRQRLDLELKERVVGLLELNKEWTEAECQETEGFTAGGSLEISEKEDLFKKVEEKLSIICAERNVLEDYLRKASLDYYADGKFGELRKKYVEIFKKPISFNDDDNDGSSDGHGDDGDGNDDDDDEDGNNGTSDKEVNDKDPYDISKVSLEDFQNEPSGTDEHPEKRVDENEKDSVDPTENEAIVDEVIDGKDDENEDGSEEDVITSTPDTYTQWLENNIDLVGEVIDCIVDEYLYVIF